MYKLTDSTNIIRLIDGVFIPADVENIDYQQYQWWLSEGNAPEPSDFPDTKAKAKEKIAELESIQVRETARFIREKTLADAEEKALSEFGIDAPTLYAMGVGEGAPPPAVAYRKLKDIDNAIKVERNKL